MIAALARIKSYLDYGVFQPIQIASIIALRECEEDTSKICAIYQKRRDVLVDGLQRAGWPVEKPRGVDVRVGAAAGAIPRHADRSSSPSCCWKRRWWRYRRASASARWARATCASPWSKTSSASARRRAPSGSF